MKSLIKKVLGTLLAIALVLVIMPTNKLGAEVKTYRFGDYPQSGSYNDIKVNEGDFIVNDIFEYYECEGFGKTQVLEKNVPWSVPYDGIVSINRYYSNEVDDYVTECILDFLVDVEIKEDEGSAEHGQLTPVSLLLDHSGSRSWLIDEESDYSLVLNGKKYKPTSVESGYDFYWQVKINNVETNETSGLIDNVENSEDFRSTIEFIATYYQQELDSIEVGVTGTTSNIKVGNNVEMNIVLLDQNGHNFVDNTQTIYVDELDSTGSTATSKLATITSSGDGYSWTYVPNAVGDHYLCFYIDDPANGVVKRINVKENVASILGNDAWPYEIETSTDSDPDSDYYYAKLAIDVNSGIEDVTYEWYATESGDENELKNFSAVSDGDDATVSISYEDHGKWFLCKVSGTKGGNPVSEMSNAVLVMDYNEIEDTLEDDACPGLYISNGTGAYTVGSNELMDVGFDGIAPIFDVIGLYNNTWVSTSYSEEWDIFTKQVGGKEQIEDNIESIKCSFIDYDDSNIVFDITFKQGCDVSINADVQLGSYDLFGDYADGAAIKANISNDKATSIQIFANKDFATSTLGTCAFVITPLTSTHTNNSTFNTFSKFNIDSYNNYYYDDENPENECWYGDIISYDGLTDAFDSLKKFIFDYNTKCYITDEEMKEWFDVPPTFVRRSLGGKNDVCVGIYGVDSNLSLAWENVKQIKFEFGVGKVKGFDNVTFTDEESLPPVNPDVEVPDTGIN